MSASGRKQPFKIAQFDVIECPLFPKADIEESRRGCHSYKKGDQSSLVGFLLQYQIDAAGFAHVPQVLPFVHLGNNLLYRFRHVFESPLLVAVNGVAAFKRNHVLMPVGAFHARRRLCSPDRYDLVGLSQCYGFISHACSIIQSLLQSEDVISKRNKIRHSKKTVLVRKNVKDLMASGP